MLKANISSTYNDTFIKYVSPEVDRKRTSSMSSFTERSTCPITLLNHFTSETTSKSNFKNLISASKELNKKVEVHKDILILNQTPRTHFTSIYQSDFKSKIQPISLSRHRA